ncbi:1-acyl-sn-glycerol-3-phosphate acyltransferase [Viscerimonas tarda]
MRRLFAFILKSLGWKVSGITEITDYPDKCILCVAPHTSNWDLIYGKLAYISVGKKAHFLMKKSWFFFPMNIFFSAFGGIPVDRKKKNALTNQLSEEFAKRDTFYLAITPEGTRKKTGEWKKGFYYIALAAKVPIIIIAMDYVEKAVYLKKVFYPTGEVDKDIEEIKAYYKGIAGRHPEKFST